MQKPKHLKWRGTCQRRGPISMPAWMTFRGVRSKNWWPLTKASAERVLRPSERCELQWALWHCSPSHCRWHVLPVHCWEVVCRRRHAWCELDESGSGDLHRVMDLVGVNENCSHS